MALSKGDLLHHFLLLQEAVGGVDAEAILNVSNFCVFVRRAGQHVVLYPQFMVASGGEQRYVRVFTPAASHFIGWLPYYNKRWDLASDKLVFKEAMARQNITVPAHALSSADMREDFLIKRRHSSFSRQIRGPYHHGAQPELDPELGEYAERFIHGKSLKVWYWNQHPVCMEINTMPTVTGDGCSSIQSLIERRLIEMKRTAIGRPRDPDAQPFDFSGVEQLLANEGKTLETILPHGVEQIVEFRYANPLMLPAFRKTIDLQRAMPADLKVQLERIGECAWHGIPPALRANTAYTIDAILDEGRVIHALEMNSNCYLHPLIYRMLLPALFPLPLRSDEKNLH